MTPEQLQNPASEIDIAAVIALGEPVASVVRQLAFERDRLRILLDAWIELASVRGDLLTCYRLGKHPQEKTLRRLDSALERIRKLQEVSP